MNWLTFAIFAPAVYSIVNFVDKYVLSKYIKDYRGMSIFVAIMAAIFGTSFWLLNGRPMLNSSDAILIIASGTFTFWAQVAYFKALSMEDTSKIMILFSMAPVITLVFSYLFLGENITFVQFIGFLLVLISVTGISTEAGNVKIKLSPAFYLILINSILWSVGAVLFKFVIDQASFIKVVAYESWGIALGGLIIYILFNNIRNPFKETVKSVDKRVLFFIFLNESIFIIARLLTFLAISLGPLVLVTIIGNTQVFFGLIFGTILTLIVPSIFKEDISKNNLIKKTGFAVIAFLGIMLISK